jgi:5-methylcytosine-specific restriction endonuclease McrA
LLEPHEGNVDHIIPKSRGGKDIWNNVVWASKEINAMKGNRLNHEVGLKLIQPPQLPREIEVWETIRKPLHRDWVHFMRRKS